jgi:ribosomal protein S18 acetylase RimI-like enzyme
LIESRTMPFHITSCTDPDWHQAIALLKRVYVRDGYTTAQGADAFMRRDVLEAGGTLMLAKASDGTVLGAVLMLRMDGELVQVAQVGEAEFRVLAVTPEARGTGVGAALVQACVAQAKASGATALVLWSQPTMPSAHRLYERLGFVRVPERDVADARGFMRLVYRLGW